MTKPKTPMAVHVVTRRQSKFPQFNRRIPNDVRERLIGTTISIALDEDEVVTCEISEATRHIRCSLRTTNKRVAIQRAANAVAAVDALFEEARHQKPFELTHRQAMALAGEFYAAIACEPDRLVRPAFVPEGFSEVLAPRNLAADYRELSSQFEAFAQGLLAQAVTQGQAFLLDTYSGVSNRLLAVHGVLFPSTASKLALAQAFNTAAVDAMRTRARYASGDYSADSNLSRYPKWEDIAPAPSGSISFNQLLDGWWAEAKAAGTAWSTYEGYGHSMRLLAEFLGHDDASAVTASNIVEFKNFRLRSTNPRTGKPISARTVRGTDLAGIRVIFGWAVNNQKLPSNPALGVVVKVRRRAKVRELEFTPEEATAILTSSRGVKNPKSQTELAQRWVPWLCAYSGCRVGEVLQLRREDFRFDKGTDSWVMRVSPEAHTVKTKEFRDIPVHPHLVELGFIEECVKSRKWGGSPYLFMTIKTGATVRGVWRSKKNRVAEFVRQTVKDPNVAPNHGWRHTFKSIGFEAGIQEKVLDAICGHAAASEGRKYGSVTLKTKVDAMQVFPRWEVTYEQRTEVAEAQQVAQ